MAHQYLVGLGIGLAIAAGCGGGGDGGGPEGTGETTSQTIGSAGGEIAVGGARLTVPPGALAADTEISVTSSSGGAPAGAAAFSPPYVFAPAGLAFAVPATLALDFSGDASTVAILWSADGTSWEALSSAVDGASVSASIAHFSTGFAADGTVGFPGFAVASNECGPAFNGDLWTCMQERCATSFAECFGPEASAGTFDGACATYGACICECPDEAGNGCACVLDSGCQGCETDSGLFDCLSQECSEFF
jgi:hypothetical protein